jgi:hypothetical protein
VMNADGTLDSARVLEDFFQAEDTYSAISRKLLENFLRLALIID